MLARLLGQWLKRFGPAARAKRSSAAYIARHMGGATPQTNRKALLEFALQQCSVEGLVLEFGVFRGESLRHIAARTAETVHGFDSFEGLPEDWSSWQKAGRFSLGGEKPEIGAANVELHKGWFQDSLPLFLAAHQGPVRFAHIDCDLYSSTRTVLAHLESRLVEGSILVFDEYLNYPRWQRHEHRAWKEFVAREGLSYEYLGYVPGWNSVGARIVSVPKSD